MRLIFLLFLLLLFAAISQNDFDYTFYTHNYARDSIRCKSYLVAPRKIHKEANVLTISSLTNSADAITYSLTYLGFSLEDEQFIYITGWERIEINPIHGTVRIFEDSSILIYY